MRALLLALLFPLLQAPSRDAVPPRDGTTPTGKVSVSGRVYSAATGEPVRGVLVFLAASPDVFDAANSRMRADAARNSVSTDAAGRFQITSAVPGVYHLVAMPSSYSGRYLPAGHGAVRGNDAGRAITIASNADLRGVDIALPSSLAIEGRVLDENGGPLSRMPVFAARLAPGSDVPERVSTVSSLTDDLGRYRIFGLDPGTYLVASEARGGVTIVDQVMGVGVGFTATSIQRDAEPFILTFHPSARSDSEAQRIRLTAQDVTGIDIVLQRLRRLKLSGIVLDSQGSPASTNMLLVRSRGLAMFSDRPLRTDDKGRFDLPQLDPGEYRLLIGAGLAPGLVSVSGRTEFAEVPLTLAADMSDVIVVTQPGIGLAGQVVFAEGSPASPPKMRLAFTRPPASSADTREIVATMDDEFRFYGSDVFGPQLVRVSGLPAGWVVKAVTLAGIDITDVPTVFKQEDHGRLQVVLTSRASTLEGTIRGEGTSPAGEATVYVFGEDRSAWRMSSPRTHKSNTSNGKFSVAGLTAGRYYAIAVAQEGFRPPANPGESFFDLLSKEATSFVIAEDERRIVELQLWRWPE